ncbi:MEKHLA domain-containing protein [Asticcacaulis solisilvae]|uniref:MEKHLA domain-containing protein n=1 Tax=Asticcacaulis solisilvae TaxID=1217274 RepID=UPI003FD71C16
MTPHLLSEVQAYSQLLSESFLRLTGRPILEDLPSGAEALFEASCPIVSHGTQADPIFCYANRAALDLWEMDWDSFTRLPSRLSAETNTETQADRNGHLEEALKHGFVEGLSGIRISSTGRRFEIRDTVLWNVVDAQGVRHGQAAIIGGWQYL